MAGDADEAQDYAELLLNDLSLSKYYDEVALKGLQLAVSDAQRSALDQDQMVQIKNTTRLLVSGLESYVDKRMALSTSASDPIDPSKQATNSSKDSPSQHLNISKTELPEIGRDAQTILCIAGRGIFDEVAAAMLDQLLGKHDLGASLVHYSDVSREEINTLDVSRVSMVCITCIDIIGNPAHLRYLIQRLRQRLSKNTPILVGLWPADDLKTKDAQTRINIGADYFVSSLDEAVTVCIGQASKLA